MARLCVCILLTVLPLCAGAECSIDPTRIGQALSHEALSLRNSLFVGLCSSAGGSLVDATDPTLGARLARPRDLQVPRGDYYPAVAGRLGYQGTVQVAMLVEIDGSIRDVTVLESSGHVLLDVAAVRLLEDSEFKTSAQLDGEPVRSLEYASYSFTLNRH